MSLSAGYKIGPYEIVAPLGAGGMGEVYRATDTKLGRDVALKILPSNMANDPDRLSRFQREARAVAALNHPNVVTLYSVEQCDGVHFLTMELVEGQPLDQLICANGLPAHRIIEIAGAIAEALSAAHDKGIVHRDLKPANVMVSNEGRVKVLDFGLAKDTSSGTTDDDVTQTMACHTQAGIAMGTPAYMSPEQLSGRPLDHRSDIFSLGVVLHEMSTGSRPFGGLSSAELVSSILRDTPQLVTDLRSDLPGDLARVIRRCLEKDPRYRMQTARDVSIEFRDMARTATPPHSTTTSPSKTVTAADSRTSRTNEGFWVAVLPFKYTGANAELKALAEGISDDVIIALSRFSYLRVIARGSTAKYSSESGDVRVIGKELGAHYILEGCFRQAGNRLRLAVQLADTTSGTHLWAETYERTFTPETAFEVQDDLVPRIVATVADAYGVLPRSMSQAARSRTSGKLTPYEALLRSFAYLERVTAEEHAHAKAALEKALQEDSDSSDCWAMLSILLADECIHGFGCEPGTLDRAVQAARRAVDLGSANHKAWQALAWAQFARKEFKASRVAAERAISLNPWDASAAGHLGQVIAYSGDWDRGCELIARAVKLNPNHPGWFWYAPFLNAYRKNDYSGALDFAFKMNMPGVPLVLVALAATHGQLGQLEPARVAVSELLALKPDYARIARREIGTLCDPPLVEHIIDGLRKAGLDIAETQVPTLTNTPSVQPSIAVLPFANMSAGADQEYFSDGLAEEIINLLAQIAGIKVIARTSSFAFRGKEQDVRQIADSLNVAHILEGSVRRSGTRIRVTAQLIVAADGSHLWSERYDRELTDIFAVQDEIASAIAKVLRVKLSRDEAPQRYTPKMAAYEAYLKGNYLHTQVTPESLELARQCFEQASELDPAYGMAHVGLGHLRMIQGHFGRVSPHESAAAARAEARRALQIDPSLAEAHALLGFIAAEHDLDWATAERHFSFPTAKQASSETVRSLYGGFQFFRGNIEQAIQLAERAVEKDPLSVWARMNLHAFLQAAGRDAEALEQLQRVLELDQNQVVALVSMAMMYADRGELPEALKIARRARVVGPWLPDTAGVLAALLRRNGEDAESQSLAGMLGSSEALGDSRAHALFHLLCGEIDQGADWAEKAIEERDFSMMYYLRFVVCKALRASHRWPRIASMINLPVNRD